MRELAHSPRRIAAALFGVLLVALATLGIRSSWAVTPDPGAAQLSQQVGRALARLGDLQEHGPLADALPASDALPGDALGLGNIFDDDAPAAVGAAESGGDCHDGDDDDSDGVADDGCGDNSSITSLADRFLNNDGTGKLDTYDAIADALQIDTSIDTGPVTLSLDITEPAVGDNSNDNGIDFVRDATTGDVDIAFTIAIAGEIPAPVNLPTYLIDLVAVDGDGVFNVPFSLTSTPLHFHFDFDMAFDDATDLPAATVAESLWLQTTPAASMVGATTAAPAFNLAIGDGNGDDLSDLDDALNLGFAGVDVDGLVALRLLWTLSLIDPDSLNGGASDFKITADEVANTDLDELVGVTVVPPPSGNAVSATFTVKSDLVGTTSDTDLTITYQAATIGAIATATPTFDPTPGSNQLKILENLRSFSATDALGGVDRLVGMLRGIQSAGFFDLDLPFIDGGTCDNGVDDDGDTVIDDGCLESGVAASGPAETGAGGLIGDVITIGSVLGDAVTDTTDGLVSTPDPVTLATEPSFTNAQQLAGKLDSGLGSHLKDVTGDDVKLSLDTTNPNAPRMIFELTLQDETTKPLAIRFGDLDILSSVVLNAGGSALLQAGYEIPLKFAFDLAPEPVEDGAGPGSCADGEDNGGDGGADGLDGSGTPETTDDDCASSRTLEQRVAFFVGETAGRKEVQLSAGLQATNITASARVGFLEVGISGGQLMFGSKDNADECNDAGDLDTPSCLATIDVDLVDAAGTDPDTSGNGWLTIEELYRALGDPTDNPSDPTDDFDYEDGWSRSVTHQAGLWSSLPVTAMIGTTEIPGAALTLTGGSDGLLESNTLQGFDASKLVDAIDINADALHLSKIFDFSACGNGDDDDGDGAIDDGCEPIADPPAIGDAETACDDDVDDDDDGAPDDGCGATGNPAAVEEPETESAALFDVILQAVRTIASELDADNLPAQFSQDLPFIGKSYKDVFDLATTLVDLADKAALGAESFLGASACTNDQDDDGDGFANDGCPQEGDFAEGGQECVGTTAVNDDASREATAGASDSKGNDGCPAVAPTLQTMSTMLDKLLTSALGSGLGTTLGDGAITATTTYDAAADDIKFAIDIADFDVQRTFPFVASLPNDLPELVSLGASGGVRVNVSGSGNIDFGVHLPDVTPFMLGSSDLRLNIDGDLVDPTTFEANVGPLKLNVGKSSPAGESGDACASGNTTDDDLDGFVNDGCGQVGDAAEDAAAGDCSYGDTADQDSDDLVNDGCAPRTDSVHAYIGGQLHVVETHDDDEKVALGDIALGGGLAGNAVIGGANQPECRDVHPAATDKHACAILPLYLGNNPVGAAGTTNHHVTLAVANLASPTNITAQYLGAGDLDTIIANAVLDLLLFESGIGPLIDKIIDFVNNQLLSVRLPLIGDALDEVVKILEGLQNLETTLNSVIDEDGPLDGAAFDVNSSQIAQLIQTNLATPLGDQLHTAGILLEPGGAARQAASGGDDLVAKVLCEDDAPCDYGAENQVDNPARQANDGDGEGNNCDAGNTTNEDDDELLNDGCAAQPNPESATDCADPGDNDGDGVDNDGCPGNRPVDGEAGEGACDGLNSDEDDDSTVDDGCPWPATNPAGYGADSTGSEATIPNACDAGNEVDEDHDGFYNDGCAAVYDKAADVTNVVLFFRIGQAASASTGTFGFDAGIPGLGLKLDNGNLSATAGWDLDMGIGVSKDHGFYFVTDEATLFGTDSDGIGPELNADATVLFSNPAGPPLSLTGTLAFLEVKATDGSAIADSEKTAPAPPTTATGVTIPAGRSFLNIAASVDLDDPTTGPGMDNRLALSEIAAGPSFTDLIDFTFTGDTQLHLGLEVGVSANVAQGLPRLTSGLHLTWGWAIAAGQSPDQLEPAGDALQMWMDGLYLDAGTFVSGFLAPIFEDVQKFTKTFEPIIDVLNEPIPVLSDFAGEPVTLRTLGEALAAAYDIDLTLIDMVIDLIDFVNSIKAYDAPTGASALLIPLTSTPGKALDLNASTLRQGALPESQALNAFQGGELANMVSSLQAGIEGHVGTQGSASTNESSGGSLTISNLDSVGISFPFLEHPERLAGLLFGKHVTLVQWEPPPLVLKFCYSQKFGPIWAVPPVFVEFGGCVTLTGNFGIGYNTKGFQRALFDPNPDVSGLLQGLFLIDRHPLEGGPDSNELEFKGEIFVNAQVSVLIFSAGAQGSLYIKIGIDLEDPNNDGITEYGEAANIIRTTGSVLCLFNLNGALGVEFSVFAEVDLFFWSQRWTKVLADIVLYEFKIKCEPLDEPELARPKTGSGTLTLNMGTDAKYRDQDDTGPDNSMGWDVVDEKWTVTRTGNGVKVRALGFTQDYPGAWTKILVTDASGGNDEVSFVDGQLGGEQGAQCDNATNDDASADDTKVNDGCDAAAHPTVDPTLPIPENAPSNPTLGGNSAATACDNAIDDDGDGKINDGCPIVGKITLLPFNIPVDVTMGSGTDTVNGGVAGGTINGGGDADVLIARGAVKYTITGGSGDDSITGSWGDDDIDAGADHDTVDAGPGKDKVIGGTGNDGIDAGRTVKTDPEAGPVQTFLDKDDTVWGDEENKHSGTDHGNDTIDGGEDADKLYGGGGADRINGGNGGDTIDGGNEDNDGCTSGVDDTIIGGPGSDTIDAMAGDDIVVGGNTIAGEPDVGDAKLLGGSGCDIVLGDNAVFDSDSNPRTFRLLDANIGGGETEIKGGTGNDIVRGQAGNDNVFGDDGEATNAFGDGADQIWGDGGNDTIRAGGGNDTVYGDGGPSHPQFGSGNDEISGAGGADTIRGEGGTDTIFGDRGKVVAGVATFTNETWIFGPLGGPDNILGGGENDKIYGQMAGDVVNGDGGDDEIHGDTDTTESGVDGNDELRGGTGVDRMFGGTGYDTMYGDAGDDKMAGGSQTQGNADAGSSGGFQDRMFGGTGLDVMTGDNAQFASVTLLDESTLGEGDLMYGQLDNDTMFGENGNDLMFGGAGDDHMEGGDDTDTVFGEGDQDDIIGGTTEPATNTGNGKQPDSGDFLYGQDGPDVIVGDNGAIVRPGGTLPGGAKVRTVTLYDLDSKDEAFFGADLIEGGKSGDWAYGGGDDDTLYGFTAAGAGVGEDTNDHLEGNDGLDDALDDTDDAGDTLFGDAGQDDLIGGTSAHVDEVTDPTPVMPADGGAHPDDGSDTLKGGDGSTALIGDHDVLLGDNATVERVLASPTAYQFDDLDVDAPDPREDTAGVLRRRIVQHDVATTTPTVFTPTSPVGTPEDDDILFGESGWDELYGQGDDDVLHGGPQDDHLEGNDGEDVLYGDGGQDDLVGGTGRTVNDDDSTAADGRNDDADVLYGGDGAGGVAEDDYDVEMGDNATVLRGEPGDAWQYNTFNASVRRHVFQYDVGVVGAPAATGTFGGDTMRGENDDDLMYGQGGGDDMQGGNGDDHMQGNEGADTMLGQADDDDMIGGTGRINHDRIEGTAGRLDSGETEMRGGAGFDWMAGDNAIVERALVDGEWLADPNGGVYRHVLRMPDLFDDEAPFGGSRDEDVVSGADLMYGDGDHDVMYGQGNSSLADDVIGDDLEGGFGDDRIEGGEGADEIRGNAGEDDLVGGTGKVLGQDSFTDAEYDELDADTAAGDPDLDLPDDVDDALNFGVRGRHDGNDLMTGEHDTDDGAADGSDSDVMLGDNAVVLRSITDADNDDQFPLGSGGVWKVRSENDSVERNPWFPDVEHIDDDPALGTHVHGDDDMWGNDNDDEMWGQGGDDLMYGGSGDDRMQGNHASDEMYGGPQEDDMLGGTGRINDDPATGTPGRLDADDLMFGQDEDDVMTGDNAIIDRPIVSGQWVTKSYKGYPDATHKAVHVAGKTAAKNTAPVAVGPVRGRIDRALTMFDLAEDLEGGSPETAGSDLMSGGPGDDDMVAQFDDSDDVDAPFTRTKAELTTLCDSPDESTVFGPASSVTTYGDVACGNSGEDAILGDQGVIVNRPEYDGRQKLLIPNTPFSRDWVFLNETLSRLVTLDQFLEGGHDVILGGDHHDAIHSGAGGDLTNGDDGDDFIFGDDGGEIDKGTRQDALWGGRGHDTSFGGWGDDFIDVQPRTNIANFPDDPADWLFFAPPDDGTGLFRGFASIDHHYGGWDQDALQADLGDNGPIHGDRLMDWVGAYNIYYLCPSTYGAWVSLRDQPPDALKHMEDLATGLGAVDVATSGSSGFREAAIVYKPDLKFNQEPPHPDTPGHFVCSGINFNDPTWTSVK